MPRHCISSIRRILRHVFCGRRDEAPLPPVDSLAKLECSGGCGARPASVFVIVVLSPPPRASTRRYTHTQYPVVTPWTSSAAPANPTSHAQNVAMARRWLGRQTSPVRYETPVTVSETAVKAAGMSTPAAEEMIVNGRPGSISQQTRRWSQRARKRTVAFRIW